MAVQPIQTFFVPLPQEQLYQSLSDVSNEVQGAMEVAVGIAVAASSTVIYYDHWEDGYEVDVTQPTQASTLVWGDGDLTNGIAPGTVDDILTGGQVVSLINTVPENRNPNQIFFDGGDRIQASFPIAVTTGSFVEHPGSYLAGATEVFDTDSWGTAYTIPIGEDTDDLSGTDPFEYTALYVMAGNDNTTVTIKNALGVTVATEVLSRGENLVYEVGQGFTVESTKPVQAQLITGDVNEQYEMRWYGLMPDSGLADEYFAPVAEETGSTGFWFYNSSNANLTVNYEGNGIAGVAVTGLAPGEVAFIEVDNGGDIDIPDGVSTGLRFFSTVADQEFIAISQIDADDRGATFDWGTRLLTRAELSPQILVGLGFGNSALNPQVSSRSVIWVTPLEDAYIHVDFDGDGIADATIEADALETIKIDDDSDNFPGAEDDQDMSGASIWATTSADPDDIDAPTVDIAAAWGQDPSRSQDGDTYALDLGTLIPPLPELTAAKAVAFAEGGDIDGDGKFDPGDILQYTITVLNFTRVSIAAGGYGIVDDLSPLFDNTTYVDDSTTYTYATGAGADGKFGTADDVTVTEAIDDSGGFPFEGPLGFEDTDEISGYERQTYTFKVQINDFADLEGGTTGIVNTAHLLVNDVSIKDLVVDIPLDFEAGIQLVKYTNGSDPTGFADLPILTVGDVVTWTYEVTNTGSVYLANVSLVDDAGTPDGDDDFSPVRGADIIGNDDEFFEPGEVWFYEETGTAELGLYRNVATVTGDPVYADVAETPVAGLPQVSDDDPSAYLGIPDGGLVGLAFDKSLVSVNGVPGGSVSHAGDVIIYEITVINTGSTAIPLVTVEDPLLTGLGGTLSGPVQTGGSGDNSNDLLDAGELWTYSGTYIVQQSDLDSRATLEPDDVAQDMIDNTASLYVGQFLVDDDSAQVPVIYECDLTATKTVTDVGGRGPASGVDNPGEVITYRIAVTNNGSLSLTGVKIDDPLLEGVNGDIGAPVESMNANGVLEVGETWTYTGTYTVSELDYYSVSWHNGFDTSFIKNQAAFETDQGCSATTNQTRTPLFTGEIICGKKGDDKIDGSATGDMKPTDSRDIIIGSGGDDTINGLGGNDWICGGPGQDKLRGGEGDDSFLFNKKPGNKHLDKILDFGLGEDKILLDHRIFKKLDTGALDAAHFANNKAGDKDDYIIFKKSKQTIAYDSNGDKKGGAVVFVKLKGDIGDIDAGDFFVV